MSRTQRTAKLPRVLAFFLPVIAASSTVAQTDMQSTLSPGMTIVVTNCNDSGPGSLRDAVARAQNGDIIVLRRLTCGRILLTSGRIQIPQMNLTFVGPGMDNLTVDANHRSAVFHHQPQPGLSSVEGTLRIRGLSIANGRRVATYFSTGGCIFSQGHVRLEYSKVHHCEAVSVAAGSSAIGGGIYARNSVTLEHSAVVFNSVFPESRSGAGGIWSGARLTLFRSRLCDNYSSGEIGGGFGGSLTMSFSTVSHNIAEGLVGGVASSSGTHISKSTISHNRADLYAGAALGNGPIRIINSTFSHNVANRGPAAFGIDGRNAPAGIFNSTVAFNTSKEPFFESCVGGVFVSGRVNFQSTIVSNNTCSGNLQDVWGRPRFGDAVLGADNLIGTSAVAVPADTISADPMLAPLADNGGPTLTHALPLGSPAIASGNNVAGQGSDQRGGGFARVVRVWADIGAYERQN